MTTDIAVFLDLDNLVIGAKQANLVFDIDLILEHIKQTTNGRIVLRRCYGDSRQSQKLLRDLTKAGFTMHSTVRLNHFGKNLADMQIVVDTMDTLVDGHQYSTYVLVTGDRDFTPLVQSLRKRGKRVIGVGMRHTASHSFVDLCDEYVYYETLVPPSRLGTDSVQNLLKQALDKLLQDADRGQASMLKQHMLEMSDRSFDDANHVSGGFRSFLEQYPHLVQLELKETTLYVRRATGDTATDTRLAPASASATTNSQERPLHLRYRTALKKQNLRVVSPRERFAILKHLINHLQAEGTYQWRELIDTMAAGFEESPLQVSKNMINAVMLAARQAEVIRTLKGESLSTAPVLLALNGERPFQQAILRCDQIYLQELLTCDEPFNLEDAARALYESENYKHYLQKLITCNGLMNGSGQ